MKQLQPNGSVLILATHRVIVGKHIDPWPTHAVEFFENAVWDNASGLFINATRFRLLSGAVFAYLNCLPGAQNIADGFATTFRIYQDRPGWNGGYGEAWNAFMITRIVAKWTQAELDAWILT